MEKQFKRLQNKLMTNKFQVDGYNLLERKRLSLYEKNDESENEKKSIRTLQLIFQANLNKFVKRNKEAIGGEIDVPSNRIILSSEEYQLHKKVLQSFDDYVDKLAKAMLLRNSHFQKQLKIFQESYKEFIAGPPLENPENDIKANNLSVVTVSLVNENSWEGYLNNVDLSKSQTIPNRPSTTTKIQNPRTEERRKSMLRLAKRPFSSQFQKQIKPRHSINLKNIDVHQVNFQNEKQKRKVPLFRQSMCEINDFQKYQQQEVYIRKKVPPNLTNFQQKSHLRIGSALYTRKGDRPDIPQKFKNVVLSKQHLDDVQKKSLYNKIMMVNTVLAFNLHQVHGYKPKSKCWSNLAI